MPAAAQRPYDCCMYNVALSVQACLRAGTRVDVAWPVQSSAFAVDPGIDAVALTPGGGKIGQLLGGAFDSQLHEIAQRGLSRGRIVTLSVTAEEAFAAGLSSAGELTCVIVPADTLPSDIWPLLLQRSPVEIISTIAETEIVASHLGPPDADASSSGEVQAALAASQSMAIMADDVLITALRAVPRFVVAGSGPVAEALAATAQLLGWQVVVEPDPQAARGHMADLSAIDSAVVLGHDVELSSQALAAALDSSAGYIGAVGSQKMQQDRADWLAYRGITDVTRVDGPAGIDIGAQTPPEIALSIVAAAVSRHRLSALNGD